MGQARRGVIEAQALERLSEAARVVRRRREEGSASGYDQSRIEIEEELAASVMRQTQAGTERLRGELASLLGRVASEVEFAGSLEADGTLTLQAGEKGDQESRPSQRLLRTAVERATAARNAATWSWLPGLVLSGGPLLSSGQGKREGYKVELSLDLPLFSRGQELRARAAARQRQAQAHVEAAGRAGHRERARARQRLAAARQEVQRFAETTDERIERLERAAQSGYREGRLSLVELLDVRRTRTQLELRQLELSLALKEAEVALRAARGDYQ
jgi:cobalt-zinc-cadmium efflux system outer membrane protein